MNSHWYLCFLCASVSLWFNRITKFTYVSLQPSSDEDHHTDYGEQKSIAALNP